MTRQDQDRSRFGPERLFATVQRHPHPPWSVIRRNSVQNDPIQRDPQIVGLRAIDLDHATLDRPIVPKLEHRSRDEVDPKPRREGAEKQADQRDEQGVRRRIGPAQQKQEAERQRHRPIEHEPGFGGQQKPQPDADPDQDRHPGKERSARLVQHAQGVNRPPHLATPFPIA